MRKVELEYPDNTSALLWIRATNKELKANPSVLSALLLDLQKIAGQIVASYTDTNGHTSGYGKGGVYIRLSLPSPHRVAFRETCYDLVTKEGMKFRFKQ